jgi:hypothetical protein
LGRHSRLRNAGIFIPLYTSGFAAPQQ